MSASHLRHRIPLVQPAMVSPALQQFLRQSQHPASREQRRQRAPRTPPGVIVAVLLSGLLWMVLVATFLFAP